MIRSLRERALRDPLLSELLRNSGLLYAAGLVAIILTVAQQLLTARYLGAENFGRLAASLGYVLVIGLVVDVRTWELGTRLLSAPYDAADAATARRVFSWLVRVEIVTGVIGLLAVLSLAPVIDSLFLDTSDSLLLVVLAPMVLFRQLALGASAASLRMLDRYSWIAIRSIVTAVARLVLVAGTAMAGADVVIVALGVVTADFVGASSIVWLAACAFRRRFERSTFTLQRPDEIPHRWQLLRSLWASATIKTLHVESFVPIAAAFTQPTQIGVLRNGLDVGNISVQLTAPLTMVMSPRIVLLTQQDDVRAIQQYVRRVQKLLAIVVIPSVVLGIVFVVALLPAILGEEFGSIRGVGSVLLVAMGISAATQWVRPLLVGLDAVNAQNRVGVVTGLLSLGLLPFLVDRWGAIGGAIDMLLFLALYSVLSVRLAHKTLHARF